MYLGPKLCFDVKGREIATAREALNGILERYLEVCVCGGGVKVGVSLKSHHDHLLTCKNVPSGLLIDIIVFSQFF